MRPPDELFMNILHILDERWDSAITEYGLSLCAALQLRGHQVWVASKTGTYAFDEAKKRGLKVLPVPSVFGLRAFLKREEIQVVNCHTGSGHFLAWASVLFQKAALVRTRGDARPLRKSWGHHRIYQRTDAVISASVCLSAQYKTLFPFLKDKLDTIYPGLSVSSHCPEPEAPLRFALVGRLDPIKGHIYFLDAISEIRNQLQNEEFLIVGEEKNTTVSGLKKYADKYGVSQWVRFLGWQEDVKDFMRSCHVGVICSIGSEALSRVCLEWMSQSRPVVATAVGCLPELIVTGENGFLVPSHGPQALAKCFLGMMKNDAFRRQMGEKAFHTVESRFSLDKFAQETEKVYEKAVRRRGDKGSQGVNTLSHPFI